MICDVCDCWVPIASTGTLFPHGGEHSGDRCPGGPTDAEHSAAFFAND